MHIIYKIFFLSRIFQNVLDIFSLSICFHFCSCILLSLQQPFLPPFPSLLLFFIPSISLTSSLHLALWLHAKGIKLEACSFVVWMQSASRQHSRGYVLSCISFSGWLEIISTSRHCWHLWQLLCPLPCQLTPRAGITQKAISLIHRQD